MASGDVTAGKTARRQRQKDSSSPDLRTWTAVLVAVIAIVGFGLTVWYLLTTAHSSTESTWQRLTYVFTGVQTVVFTAVGWVFGREVNRRQAETAQQRADEATEAEKDAVARVADLDARGRAAKAAVAARQATYTDTAKVRARGFAGTSAGAAAGDIDELASFMNALFPD